MKKLLVIVLLCVAIPAQAMEQAEKGDSKKRKAMQNETTSKIIKLESIQSTFNQMVKSDNDPNEIIDDITKLYETLNLMDMTHRSGWLSLLQRGLKNYDSNESFPIFIR